MSSCAKTTPKGALRNCDNVDGVSKTIERPVSPLKRAVRRIFSHSRSSSRSGIYDVDVISNYKEAAGVQVKIGVTTTSALAEWDTPLEWPVALRASTSIAVPNFSSVSSECLSQLVDMPMPTSSPDLGLGMLQPLSPIPESPTAPITISTGMDARDDRPIAEIFPVYKRAAGPRAASTPGATTHSAAILVAPGASSELWPTTSRHGIGYVPPDPPHARTTAGIDSIRRVLSPALSTSSIPHLGSPVPSEARRVAFPAPVTSQQTGIFPTPCVLAAYCVHDILKDKKIKHLFVGRFALSLYKYLEHTLVPAKATVDVEIEKRMLGAARDLLTRSGKFSLEGGQEPTFVPLVHKSTGTNIHLNMRPGMSRAISEAHMFQDQHAPRETALEISLISTTNLFVQCSMLAEKNPRQFTHVGDMHWLLNCKLLELDWTLIRKRCKEDTIASLSGEAFQKFCEVDPKLSHQRSGASVRSQSNAAIVREMIAAGK